MPIKPGKRDIKCNVLIQGAELDALHAISYLLSESFGLDTRILNYKGKRPIGLYSWDFECLRGGIEYALTNAKPSYPELTEEDKSALAQLLQRLNGIYQEIDR